MAWLSSLLKKPEPVVEIAPVKAPVATGPQLAVLVPDIAGISSFRLKLFPDAAAAEAHISELRPEVRRGVHAFWALHEKPVRMEDLHVETLVMIRAREGSDVVYVVSFLDLESANSFTRFEVRRGLQLPNVMISWAAFTQIREELDGVTIHPGVAPITSPSWLDVRDEIAAPVAPERALPVPVIEAPPVPETLAAAEVMEPETPVESEARDAIERYLEQQAKEERNERPLTEDRFAVMDRPRAAPEVVPEPEPAPDLAPEPEPEPEVASEPQLAPAAEAARWPDPEAEVEKPLWPTLEAVVPDAPAAEPEVLSPVPEEQAALEQAFVLSHEHVIPAEAVTMDTVIEDQAPVDVPAAIGTAAEAAAQTPELPERPRLSSEAVEAGMVDVEEPAGSQPVVGDIVLDGPTVVTVPGDEETEDEPAPEVEALAASADPAAGIPHVKQYDEFDIAFEVERLLRNRNWGRRDEPFDGFKSPPGRF